MLSYTYMYMYSVPSYQNKLGKHNLMLLIRVPLFLIQSHCFSSLLLDVLLIEILKLCTIHNYVPT